MKSKLMHYNRKHLPANISSWFDLETSRVSHNLEYLNQKKVVIADCDGILTDSKSQYDATHKVLKTYGAYDKEAIELLSGFGWEFIFVTDDKAGKDITFARLQHLKKSFSQNLDFKQANRNERYDIIKMYLEKGYFVLFIGDSLSDIKSLNIATMAATTNNAPDDVKEYCNIVSDLNGGDGGFADIVINAHKELSEDGKSIQSWL